MQIDTPRLKLIACTREMLEAFFKGEAELAALLSINIPDKWTEFGDLAFRWAYEELNKGETGNERWLCYLPILKDPQTLAGSCGYKGRPRNGVVEIGYEVAESFRGRGLASEMAGGLIDHAFENPEITLVQAHTLAAENASATVLKKCGMERMEEIDDPEDGRIWRWEIRRSAWQQIAKPLS